MDGIVTLGKPLLQAGAIRNASRQSADPADINPAGPALLRDPSSTKRGGFLNPDRLFALSFSLDRVVPCRTRGGPGAVARSVAALIVTREHQGDLIVRV